MTNLVSLKQSKMMLQAITIPKTLQMFSTDISPLLEKDMPIKLRNQKNIAAYLDVITSNTRSIFFDSVTPTEVETLIKQLPNKKSSGYDQIDNILLKEISDVLVPSLCSLFNRSINEGVFPDSMKYAEVFPLHKGKDKNLCMNYRPISLLITLSKLLEKVVYLQTYNFLNTTSQIYESQYGFRAKHSCKNAIQELVGNILKGQENGKMTLAVFLDLSKAFDTISHSVLFEKLNKYGIRGICLDGLEYSEFADIEFRTPPGLNFRASNFFDFQ